MALAEAYTILFTMPLIASVLAIPLLGERVGLSRWCLIALGFLGVLVVLRPGFVALQPAAFCALAAAFVFAFFDVTTRKMGKNEVWLSFALYPALVTASALGGLIAYSGNFVAPALGGLLIFAAAGAGHMAGSLLTARGYIMTPIALASPFQYTQLLWGIVLGRIFFQETPDIWTLAGAACIITSSMTSIWMESRKASSIQK